MSKKKTKKFSVSVPAIQTVDGLRASVNALIEKQTRLERSKAKRDLEIAQIQTLWDEDNGHLIAEIEALSAMAHVFCETNRVVFGEEKKSIDVGNAVVGFRFNPWKVEKVVSKDTFEAISKRLQAVPWGAPFVRTVDPEVNRELLLAERANLDVAQLASVGLRITQAETFYIEPKVESAAGSTATVV